MLIHLARIGNVHGNTIRNSRFLNKRHRIPAELDALGEHMGRYFGQRTAEELGEVRRSGQRGELDVLVDRERCDSRVVFRISIRRSAYTANVHIRREVSISVGFLCGVCVFFSRSNRQIVDSYDATPRSSEPSWPKQITPPLFEEDDYQYTNIRNNYTNPSTESDRFRCFLIDFFSCCRFYR